MVKAYAFIRACGSKGLKKISENSIINANYIMNSLKDLYNLPYPGPCMHEFVLSGINQKSKGVRTLDIAKRILDYGLHAPTVYFPLIVSEALMIEPTETESIEELDRLVNALIEISAEAYTNANIVLGAPRNTSVDKVDEAAASHPKTMALTWKMMSKT